MTEGWGGLAGPGHSVTQCRVGRAWGQGHCDRQDGEPSGPAWHPVPPVVGDQPPPPCSGLLKLLGVRHSAGPRGQVLEASLPRLFARFGDLVRGQNKSATAVIQGPTSLKWSLDKSCPRLWEGAILPPEPVPVPQATVAREGAGPGSWQEDGESREAQRKAGGCRQPGLAAGITPTKPAEPSRALVSYGSPSCFHRLPAHPQGPLL